MAKRRKSSVADALEAFRMTYGLTRGVMSDSEVANVMKEKATESIGGDYQKGMGLEGADQQAAQLKEQDNAFGKEGATATADALNSNTADLTPASAQGLTTRYKMFDTESDTPFGQQQVDEMRMSKTADIYTKYGQADKALALKKHVGDSQRQRATDARQVSQDARQAGLDARTAEEFDWKKKDRVTAEGDKTRAIAVQKGLSGAVTENLAAQEGSKDFAAYQSDLLPVIGKGGIDATIRAEATRNGATPDQIESAVAAYRGSVDGATAQHNAAGMSNLNKQFASVYAGIGNDPEKAMKFLQMAESEGAPKLIAALKSGKIDLANQLWNGQGNSRGDIVKRTIRDSKTGDTVAEVINAYTGEKRFENITAMERALMSATETAKLRETDSKTLENEAQRAAAFANADQSRAGAGKARAETAQTGEETRILKATGAKPTADSGKTKTDAREVDFALGTPLSERGRPLTDNNGVPLRQSNPQEVTAYYKWKSDKGIKTDDEGLSRWLAGERVVPAAPKAKPVKPNDPNYRPWR